MISRQFLFATAVLLALAIGMGVYVRQLQQQQRESSIRQRPVAEEHVKPPESGPQENATIWIADDDPGVLRPQSVSIPLASGRQQRSEELLRALVSIYTQEGSPHHLQPGAEVRSVYLVEPNLAVIDLNPAFVAGQASGILAEELTIASMVQTLSTNVPGLSRVKILVDGNQHETLAGHADISGFYDVNQVAELAKQLSTP
jgi:Sporulation and spore germination